MQQEYSFTSDATFSPDTGITYFDENALFGLPDPSEIRPTSTGAGAGLEANPRGASPYVEIDLLDPFKGTDYVNVKKVLLPGNLLTVKIYVKTSDSVTGWTYTEELPVDPTSGLVILPTTWATSNCSMVPIAVLRIEPLTATNSEMFQFKVDLVGCYGKGRSQK